VVPNRGAAAHKGAVKRCQGCRQILNLLPLELFLPPRVAKIVILACNGAAKFFSVLQGAVKQKRLKNTALDYHFWHVRVLPNFFCPKGFREPQKVKKISLYTSHRISVLMRFFATFTHVNGCLRVLYIFQCVLSNETNIFRLLTSLAI
jgi:hypothetical protein